MNDTLVRRASERDDRLAIASCLYLTDPFIYPAAFGNEPRRGAQAIAALIDLKAGLFHSKNLAIALYGDTICGVLLFNRGGVQWDFERCTEAVRSIVPNIAAFEYVAKEYFSDEASAPSDGYVKAVACCVMPEFRNKGIGRDLLDWLIKDNPRSAISLDVLANNAAAIALYKKLGFTTVRSFKGFCLDEKHRPSCYRMERIPRLE